MPCCCSYQQNHRLASLPISLFNNCLRALLAHLTLPLRWCGWNALLMPYYKEMSHVSLVETSLEMIPVPDFPKRSMEVISLSSPASSLPLLPTDVDPTDIPNIYSGCKSSACICVAERTTDNPGKPHLQTF